MAPLAAPSIRKPAAKVLSQKHCHSNYPMDLWRFRSQIEISDAICDQSWAQASRPEEAGGIEVRHSAVGEERKLFGVLLDMFAFRVHAIVNSLTQEESLL